MVENRFRTTFGVIVDIFEKIDFLGIFTLSEPPRTLTSGAQKQLRALYVVQTPVSRPNFDPGPVLDPFGTTFVPPNFRPF